MRVRVYVCTNGFT